MGKLFTIKNEEDLKFRITNKTETNAEIILYSIIGFIDWDGEGVTATSFSEELKSLPKTVKEISVRINSPGGSVFDGITIYNRLKQHPAKITVYIDGMAASIASIIALAGDEVIAGEGSQYMIHKPMSGIYGNSIEMEEMINRLDDVEEQLVGIYRRKTGLDRSEIKAMLSKETWMSATQAQELGFVDTIMEPSEEIRIAASANKFDKVPWMKNVKINSIASNSKYIKKQLDKFKQDAEALLTR